MKHPLNPAVSAYNVRRCHICRASNPPFGFGTLAMDTIWACPQHRAEVDAIWMASRVRPRSEPADKPGAAPVVKARAKPVKAPREQESLL